MPVANRVNIAEEDLPALGLRIAAARKRLGLKGEQMADGLGVTRTYLSQVENGHKRPSMGLVEGMRRVFGVSPDYVLFGQGGALLLAEAKSSFVNISAQGKQVAKSDTVTDLSTCLPDAKAAPLLSLAEQAPAHYAGKDERGTKSRGAPPKVGSSAAGATALLPRKGAIEARPLVLSLPTEEADGRKTDYEVIPKFIGRPAGGKKSLEQKQLVSWVGDLALSTDWLERNLGPNTGMVVSFEVQNDAMMPTFHEGDTVLIDRGQVQLTDGIFLVFIDGERKLRRVQRLAAGKLLLLPDNSRYQSEQLTKAEAEKLEVLGKLVWPRGR